VKDGGSGTIQARFVQRDAQSLNPIGVVIESDDVFSSKLSVVFAVRISRLNPSTPPLAE